MSAAVNVDDLPAGPVTLDVECLDRIYLNGDVPAAPSGWGWL